MIEGGPHEEPYEDPDEAKKGAEAVIAAIGTDREFETFGYEYHEKQIYVCSIGDVKYFEEV